MALVPVPDPPPASPSKPAKQSKTLGFNGALLAIAAFLATIPVNVDTEPMASIAHALPEKYRNILAGVLAFVAAVNGLLRLFTSQAITGSPADPAPKP